MIKPFRFRGSGILLLVLSSLLFVGLIFFRNPLFDLIQTNFSSDHHITLNGQREIARAGFFGAVLLFGLGVGFLKAQDLSWRKKLMTALLSEPLSGPDMAQPSPGIVLIASTTFGLLLIASMRLANHFPAVRLFLYRKDHGLLDMFVPVTMIACAVLLITAVWRFQKQSGISVPKKFKSSVYLVMSGLFIFNAGEEMSWGQDFFRWQTPALFDGNLEAQTNMHNYFNPYFDLGYTALSLVLIVILVSIGLEFQQRWLSMGRVFLPHPSLIGLGLLIAFVAIVWYQEQELLEELVAVFVLFYSIRIFTCAYSRNKLIEQ